MVSINGKFKDINKAALNALGYTKEQLIGKPMETIYAPESQAKMKLLFEKWKKSEKLIDEEITIITRSGKKRAVLLSAEMIKSESGEVLHSLSVQKDITERKRIEEKLKRSQRELQDLSAHLQNIREEDRAHIAREIHDDLGQSLTALKMNLSLLEEDLIQYVEKPKRSTIKNNLRYMGEILDETVSKVRQLITELRPEILDTLGILDALEWQLEEFQKRFGILVKFSCNITELNLTKERSLAVFRVFQEALTNIIRHAKATKVDIKITKQRDQLLIIIKDNGIGFSYKRPDVNNNFGIIGMRERTSFCQGKLEINSRKGIGTTVLIQIPIWTKP